MKSNVDTANTERVRIKRQPGQVQPLWEAWELAHEDVGDAYLGWRNAAPEDRADAYCAYVAATDREAAAEDFLRAGAPSAAGSQSA